MLFLCGMAFDAPLSRLTRPQIQWISEVNTYKAKMMQARKGKPGAHTDESGGARRGYLMQGTPEQIAHILYPKMIAQEKAAKEREIAEKTRIMKEWEERHKRIKERGTKDVRRPQGLRNKNPHR